MRPQAVLDRAAALALGVGGHHQRRNLFTLRDFKSDDRDFLDVGRMAVDLFEFVDIYVVAARIDDDILGAADDIERPSSSKRPRSPVWSHPSLSTSSVAD